jgi:hypothetical protein
MRTVRRAPAAEYFHRLSGASLDGWPLSFCSILFCFVRLCFHYFVLLWGRSRRRFFRFVFQFFFQKRVGAVELIFYRVQIAFQSLRDFRKRQFGVIARRKSCFRSEFAAFSVQSSGRPAASSSGTSAARPRCRYQSAHLRDAMAYSQDLKRACPRYCGRPVQAASKVSCKTSSAEFGPTRRVRKPRRGGAYVRDSASKEGRSPRCAARIIPRSRPSAPVFSTLKSADKFNR